MTSLSYLRFVAVALVFALCQVIGTMCVLPDIATAGDAAALVEENLVCPMDGTIMCPSSLTSSPERQVKNSSTMDVDHSAIVIGASTVATSPSAPTPWSWSSVLSIVPISIESSSVLRI